MLKVSNERNVTRKTNNYNTRDSYSDFTNYYNEYNYDTVDLNDTYDYTTRYDVDFAYDDYDLLNRDTYVAPTEEPRYSSFREYSKVNSKTRSERKAKTHKLTPGMKALMIVYFAIVAVIATLLIVNALPMMAPTNTEMSIEGMENVEPVNVEANALYNVALADGTIATLSASESVPYEYTINSNWFDDMCDWMENMAA